MLLAADAHSAPPRRVNVASAAMSAQQVERRVLREESIEVKCVLPFAKRGFSSVEISPAPVLTTSDTSLFLLVRKDVKTAEAALQTVHQKWRREKL